MLTRRRSDQHSARQTVRRLAFLADHMRFVSQTVFTLELLDKYAMPSRYLFSYNSPTARSSLICGLAGGLVLGVAGLVAYGWRGGLAGAVIGAAVGLSCVERINSANLRYQRARNQERQWMARNRIDRMLDGPIDGFYNLLNTPGALGVAGNAAAVVGVLLGWPEGLLTGLSYAVREAAKYPARSPEQFCGAACLRRWQ